MSLTRRDKLIGVGMFVGLLISTAIANAALGVQTWWWFVVPLDLLTAFVAIWILK